MNDWYKPCDECGGTGVLADSTVGFAFESTCDKCDGDRFVPVTAADLEGLGKKVWFCKEREFPGIDTRCVHINDRCGWRLLIPIPDPVAAE